MSNDNPGVGGLLPPSHGTEGGAPRPGAAPAAPGPQHVQATEQPLQHSLHPADGPAPQHVAGQGQVQGPQHGAPAHQFPAPEQHAAPGHQPPAPQHAGSPLQPPHADSALQAPQHVGHATTGAAQHGAPLEGPHANTVQHVAPGHGGASSGRGPWTRLRHLRHARPRMHMLLVGGTGAVVITAGALAVAKAQSDDPPRQIAVATTTTLAAPVPTSAPVVVITAAPVTVPVTIAPVATEPATTDPATTEPPTTIADTTTTVAALPSGAGNYNITTSNITISGDGFTTSAPSDVSQTWMFTGACDGVGDCSISAAGGDAVLSTGAAGSIFSGPGSTVALVPAGNGGYTSTFQIPIDSCGSATGNLTITVGGGSVHGDYAVTIAGSGASCPLTNITATYDGTLAG
ncbi:MAG: hypothetical protein JWM34_4030 [Ilumatobacteraceae bacterium]|nr:hypothetical protein [Ilumatobacteraceae bacterium]